MLFAVPVIAAGLFLNSTYMLIIGLATHGICLYDYSKTLSLSLDDGKVALAQDGLLFLFFSVGAVLTWIGVIPAIALVAIWALAGAVIGYAAAALQCYRLWPRWSGDPDELRTSIGFGVQGLIGGGSVHVSTFLLALVGGANIVGSIRGASTLIGPANLVTSSLQPLLISYFSRTAPRAGEISMPSLFKSAAGMVCVQLFLAGALTLVGYFFGDVLLGPVWQDSEPLLVIVAVDAVLVAAGAAPLAAHRTLWKSGRLARINSCMVVMRLTLVIFGALLWGAQGAALGLLTVTLVGSVIWWTSIIQLRDH
jgi:O-antigen/teichoic acid export membrane protein